MVKLCIFRLTRRIGLAATMLGTLRCSIVIRRHWRIIFSRVNFKTTPFRHHVVFRRIRFSPVSSYPLYFSGKLPPATISFFNNYRQYNDVRIYRPSRQSSGVIIIIFFLFTFVSLREIAFFAHASAITLLIIIIIHTIAHKCGHGAITLHTHS